MIIQWGYCDYWVTASGVNECAFHDDGPLCFPCVEVKRDGMKNSQEIAPWQRLGDLLHPLVRLVEADVLGAELLDGGQRGHRGGGGGG